MNGLKSDADAEKQGANSVNSLKAERRAARRIGLRRRGGAEQGGPRHPPSRYPGGRPGMTVLFWQG